MSINWEMLDARAKDFNNLYKTKFNFSEFYTKITTLRNLDSKNAADIAYKGTLGAVLKDALVIACHKQSDSQNAEKSAVDLMQVIQNFEESLMQPFVSECRNAGEKLYPQPYGGMSKKQRIELVEKIVNVSPKNDVELTEQAYKSGKIRLRDMREAVNDMPFAVGKAVDRHQVQRIATFMLAIENVNKSRPLWWRIIHPFRNNAEQRDAREYKSVLQSFGGNALQVGEELAPKEYKTLELTRESINNAKAELENEKNLKPIEHSNVKDPVKVEIDNEINHDLSKKIEEVKDVKKDDLIIRKNG